MKKLDESFSNLVINKVVVDLDMFGNKNKPVLNVLNLEDSLMGYVSFFSKLGKYLNGLDLKGKCM